ncbi:MAG: pyridoxal-phosphate dependent enzyme, partial [Lysobacterales bacterium]
ADGIAVARVGMHTYPQAAAWLDGIVTVDEESIARAILTLLEQEKLLAEGAGAVGIAALLDGVVGDPAGKRIVAVVSGGNIDPIELAKIVERGLERDGRLAHLRVVVADRPGSIAEVAGLVARERANILQISQRRDAAEVGLREAELDLTLETRGLDHVTGIVQALRDGGFRVR